jgi:hypothetical protein
LPVRRAVLRPRPQAPAGLAQGMGRAARRLEGPPAPRRRLARRRRVPDLCLQWLHPAHHGPAAQAGYELGRVVDRPGASAIGSDGDKRAGVRGSHGDTRAAPSRWHLRLRPPRPRQDPRPPRQLRRPRRCRPFVAASRRLRAQGRPRERDRASTSLATPDSEPLALDTYAAP